MTGEKLEDGSAPLEAIIVDVGHGNSAIVRDGRRCVVIDAPMQDALFEELVRCHIARIEHLVLSHSDADHMSGAVRLLWDEGFSIGTVWCNSDGLKATKAWQNFARQLNIRFQSGAVSVETALNTGAMTRLSFGRVKVEVLHPDIELALLGPTQNDTVSGKLDSNRMSAVIRVSLAERPAVLLPADIDAASLERILSQQRELSAPVLVFPHHGGRTGSGLDRSFAYRLCGKTDPELVVFSIARGGPYMNPSTEILAGVREAAPRAHIACTQLSRNCHSGSLNQPGPHAAGRAAAGRRTNTCCVGTLAVVYTPDGLRIEPAIEDHRVFVSNVVAGPKCIRSSAVPAPRVAAHDFREETAS